MRNPLAIMLLAGACCLVFSQEAKADVNTITEVSYYEPTNSLLAWAEITTDYDTLAYYEVGYWGQLSKDDVGLTMFSGAIYDNNDVYYEEYFPYDPDADYTIEVYPQLVAKIQHNYGDTYEDYYDYVQWSYGNQVYYPYYYGFTGLGPDVQIDGTSILLGGVYSIFSMGATSGPPHHLKVVSDNTFTESCGSKKRHIKFRAVDSNGRKAGSINIVEELFDSYTGARLYSVYDSCQNNYFSPIGCSSMDSDQTFTDQLWVGCPSSGGDCGFQDMRSVWYWCARGRPNVALTRNLYQVRHNSVLVNGVTQYSPGTHLYP
jgi:hypothetical protein